MGCLLLYILLDFSFFLELKEALETDAGRVESEVLHFDVFGLLPPASSHVVVGFELGIRRNQHMEEAIAGMNRQSRIQISIWQRKQNL